MSAIDETELLVIASDLLKTDRDSDKALASVIKQAAAELAALRAENDALRKDRDDWKFRHNEIMLPQLDRHGVTMDKLRAELEEVQFSHGLLEKDLAYQEQDVLPKLRAEIAAKDAELDELRTKPDYPYDAIAEKDAALEDARGLFRDIKNEQELYGGVLSFSLLHRINALLAKGGK